MLVRVPGSYRMAVSWLLWEDFARRAKSHVRVFTLAILPNVAIVRETGGVRTLSNGRIGLRLRFGLIPKYDNEAR